MKISSARGREERSSRHRWGRVDAVLVVAAFVALAAARPVNAQTSASGDPPSRVARLSDVSGQVWIYSGESDEWLTVERNRPLTTGDRIATDNGARAEITLGTTTLRLDAGTEIEVAQLDDSRYIVRVVNGSVAARLRNPQALAEFEIDTDEGRFRVQTVGRYRFDHLEQTSDLTVFAGQAIYESKNSALPVYTGQHAQFWIDAAGVPQYATVPPARDAFAAWNDERDRGEDRFATNRFVSPEMTGSEDLARYGQWQQTPDDGPIWVPTSVPVDWAPYSAGHWAWVRPWGWTWVDDAPWGFAPFHYGRWVYRSNVWCWAPGTYVARPVYAPALVAWIGGPRVGVSLSIGGGGPPVGWFPLAPREVYVPSYRASTRYVREVNITHVTNVANITTIVNNKNGEADRRDFANRNVAHAVTFVPADVITRRQPVGPAAARFRNDPQMRALVADAKPAPALIAAPVAAPAAAPRLAPGRQPARPPFEGRAPGSLAGRPEGGRPDVGRAPVARPEVGRAPTTAPVGAAPSVAPRVESPRQIAAPPVGATPAPARTAPDPGIATQRVAPPSPVQRGAQAGAEGARPGLPPRGNRGVAEGVNGDGRAAPQAASPSLPIPNPALSDGSMGRRSERAAPPRQVDPARAAEVARPAPVARTPEVAGPQVVAPRAAEARPVEVARPVMSEPRINRPEAPRGKDDRRPEKEDRPR